MICYRCEVRNECIPMGKQCYVIDVKSMINVCLWINDDKLKNSTSLNFLTPCLTAHVKTDKCLSVI